jgi:hypothetical protein
LGRIRSTNGRDENAYIILVLKPEGIKPLGRPSSKWEDNIRKNFREVECEGVDWMDLVQDRDQCRDVVNTVMKLRVL